MFEIRFETPETSILKDCDHFDRKYREAVLELYRNIIGQPYSVEDKGLTINLSNELAWGFPYGTQNATIIGSFLVAYGYLIRMLSLRPGAKILELDCGTAALTWHLSKSGYEVTAADINESNIALIKSMTEHLTAPPNVVRADIAKYQTSEKYDAIIFFESFRHFIEHQDLLARCKGWLTPGGVIALAAEPIVDDSQPVVPYPWGLRLDGESLRAMYKYGWIELGFRDSYFVELLRRTGLHHERHRSTDVHWADVILARPAG